jgi:hypothetical protein
MRRLLSHRFLKYPFLNFKSRLACIMKSLCYLPQKILYLSRTSLRFQLWAAFGLGILLSREIYYKNSYTRARWGLNYQLYWSYRDKIWDFAEQQYNLFEAVRAKQRRDFEAWQKKQDQWCRVVGFDTSKMLFLDERRQDIALYIDPNNENRYICPDWKTLLINVSVFKT